MKKVLLTSILFSVISTLLIAANYTGRVFADANGNGIYDKGEKLLSGIGASDGYLYGVDKKSGEAVWKHNTGSPVFGTVAISGNSLFAVDFSGNVYGFAAE